MERWKGPSQTKPDAKPYRGKPYPIPVKNQEDMKHQVFRQFNIGTLWELSGGECKQHNWAFPTFGALKKNSIIRFLFDVHVLNAQVVCRGYLLRDQGPIEQCKRFQVWYHPGSHKGLPINRIRQAFWEDYSHEGSSWPLVSFRDGWSLFFCLSQRGTPESVLGKYPTHKRQQAPRARI